mmetsp:Transcript_10618/g.20563  ORF Transcript_10618/g.20563 Transcript_10618/m.20563 type:complete len:358 (+) Transcript_10618:68-1141(+)|eukprot:CAMPEP_0172721268 /NCGR_PEP_ID=MMETSP1074-20121228/78696_1 /TAXON_ID=2916 /ORGANISM="Ceratium fusus, Strain PA161109" /LENGTH=357 /DNA_ID=CAMNT_0013546967 /DNA_START=59 /DNA_END=1132 /DNA_ORIENTATION=-
MGNTLGYKKPKNLSDKWYPEFVATLPRMDDKIVAVTGSTTGTGFSCAMTCRQLGATVVLLNRDSDRVVAMRRSLSQLPGGTTSEGGARQSTIEGQLRAGDGEEIPDDPKIITIPCDLSSFSSVRSAIGELNSKFSKTGIDVLVNNAGVMALKDTATEDGFDIQMQVNHLSHFMLTQAMMPLLESAAAKRGEARIVNHSSIARTMVTSLEAKYFEKNGGNLGGNGMTAPWTRYGQTKKANAVFTHALHDYLQKTGSKVKAMYAHPGVAATHLQVTTVESGAMPGFAASAMVSQSANDGALGIIRCACAADVKSGEFYGPTKEGYKGPADLLPPDDYSEEQKTLLWERSSEACGVKFGD